MRMAPTPFPAQLKPISEQASIRVAVVEDTPEVREGLSWLMSNSVGFQCVGAYATGEEALRDLPRHHPEVVLMDIDLPGMSGIECMEKLRNLCPGVQVSMLTVFEDEDKILRSLVEGATGYLLKNTPPAGILDAVRDLHAGGSPMSSQVARKVLNSFLRQTPSKRLSVFSRLARSPDPVQPVLCRREHQILDLLARGHRYKEIADELGVTIHTVRTFIRRMYEKLRVHSRTEAIMKVEPR